MAKRLEQLVLQPSPPIHILDVRSWSRVFQILQEKLLQAYELYRRVKWN